jgi:hypothetical protein
MLRISERWRGSFFRIVAGLTAAIVGPGANAYTLEKA